MSVGLKGCKIHCWVLGQDVGLFIPLKPLACTSGKHCISYLTPPTVFVSEEGPDLDVRFTTVMGTALVVLDHGAVSLPQLL